MKQTRAARGDELNLARIFFSTKKKACGANRVGAGLVRAKSLKQTRAARVAELNWASFFKKKARRAIALARGESAWVKPGSACGLGLPGLSVLFRFARFGLGSSGLAEEYRIQRNNPRFKTSSQKCFENLRV